MARPMPCAAPVTIAILLLRALLISAPPGLVAGLSL
jgi:hypothetical protein